MFFCYRHIKVGILQVYRGGPVALADTLERRLWWFTSRTSFSLFSSSALCDWSLETTVCLFYQERIRINHLFRSLTGSMAPSTSKKSTSSWMSLLFSLFSLCTGGFVVCYHKIPVCAPLQLPGQKIPVLCVPPLHFLLQLSESCGVLGWFLVVVLFAPHLH